ncbi:MAG: M20/M25/M40 family metallo-hydrolase [Acidobacteria bacterium]|nr:M20/M25/M40 family metallo-hydrolase [Acidobacteriota bacterium]
MTQKPVQPATASTQSVSAMVRDLADADQASVISLIQDLVRIPTRGGIDTYDEIIEYMTRWLESRGLPCRQLTDQATGSTLALVSDIRGARPGPRYVLDACLDTAPFGDVGAWRYPPTSGTIENGWLHGRGAADSKAAIAIFAHLADRVHRNPTQLHGTLTLLFDADEHTGNFGGAKQYFGGTDTPRDIRGVMIGYPGIDELVIGGRGFLRATATVRGQAGHTGSQRAANNINAVEKAAELVRHLASHRAPGPVDATLGLPPKVTVTEIFGGESYSIIPDHCTVSVDMRLTTDFDRNVGNRLIEEATAEIDEQWPSSPTTTIFHESWPAYRLDENASIRTALMCAAEHHLEDPVTAKVAGPSNIGNYLAKHGINATAGFGVNYRGLHGTDERIELSTIPAVQAVYHEAVLTLLNPTSSSSHLS